MRRRPHLLGRAALAALALGLMGMRYPPPHEIGHLVLDQRARKAGVPGVGFDHYRHRASFTCRVCHVDVGFAMTLNESGITAKTNQGGFHCGACHDGKRTHRGAPIFAACREGRTVDGPGECKRCHAREDAAKLKSEYERFASRMPRNPHGAVDWEKAEAQGRVKPADVLEGVSVPRPPMRMDRDIPIAAEASWVADIIFSHRKHAVWNGCEVCHPDIFPASRAGATKYTMFQISRGEYCGACHDKVAFPIADCEGCHKKPVR
jgi:c(7)-type cytochrome triheme protein